MIATVTKDDLVALGFSEGTSRSIIRKGNTSLFNVGSMFMIINGLEPYLQQLRRSY